MTEGHTPPEGYMRGRQHVRDGIGRDFSTAEYFRVQALKNMARPTNNEERKSYREYVLGMYDEATRQQEIADLQESRILSGMHYKVVTDSGDFTTTHFIAAGTRSEARRMVAEDMSPIAKIIEVKEA